MSATSSNAASGSPKGILSGYGVVALAFITVVTVLGAVAVSAVGSFKAPPKKIVNGDMVRAFEKHYDEEFPLRIASINVWTAAQLVLFGEGRLGVVIGTDGWLYTNEEFNVIPKWKDAIASNLKVVSWVHGELSRAGVPLMIVIVPEKAKIYPEHIGKHERAAAHQNLGAQLVATADALNLPIIDLTTVLSEGRNGGQTYLRTDTHWTPYGAELAAKAVKVRLQELNLTDAAAKPGDYATTEGAEVVHRGDLLSFLPLEPMFKSLMPPVEMIRDVDTTASAALSSEMGLFDDTKLPEVALVGTSYSANPKWNFSGYLEDELNEGVANYSEEGVGPFPPMMQFLGGKDFKEHKPRLVIWEIPERSLLSKVDLGPFQNLMEVYEPVPVTAKQ